MTNTKHIFIGLFMLVSAGLALALTPHKNIQMEGPKIDLETMIPKQFGDWTIDSQITPIMPNPQQEAMLDTIYSQTLSRTYINSAGLRIMLSIAYGGDQSRSLQVHKPEVCYASQGFQIGNMSKTVIDTPYGKLPVMHLVAKQGERIEPITYWIKTGDLITRGWYEQNLARLSYGLSGKIPDGLLVRVSNLSRDENDSYRIQQAFLSAMLNKMSKDSRVRLVGQLGA